MGMRPTWQDDLENFLSDAQVDLWCYLRGWKRAEPYGNCPLPTLYRHAAEPLGLSLGQFHDCLRGLVAQRKVRLHPYTGAAFQLQDEQCGLMMGQELKFYAEPLA